MKRILLLFSLVAFVVSQASAYKKQSINITVNNKQRNMIVFTPNKLPAKSPLFIVTHGMNQSPEYQLDSDKMYEMIDTAKFVVAYLRSDGSTWDTGGTNDQAFVTKTITAMADSFDIDKERVYWSGFSMGSMLIHHCIANMQGKIAAFAPTSGIQFSESPWNNCQKPVNLLEVIAYGDDVFGYEQYNIHGYIENYAKHEKHTRYSKTVGYKAKSSNWQNGDLEKWTGGANGGEVWLYSYNNGGHWPSDQNRFLIWEFCKRFSLNQPTATFTEPAGETTFLCLAPKGEASFPDVTVTVSAKPVSGQIEKVEIYDGKTLLDSATTASCTTTLTAPSTGKHSLRVVAKNSKEKSGEGTCLVNCVTNSTATSTYTLSQTFKQEGVVPQNWYVSNGSTKRVTNVFPLTSGCRLLRFTNTTKAFTYGLLVQNVTTKAKSAWAKFGDAKGRSHLTLHAGTYALKYKVCNWNQPEFTPVTVAIEDLDGKEIASQDYTPTVNIGNDVGNKFSGVTQQVFEFDIPETGDYVIVFYADGKKNADFVLGQASIQPKSFVATGIKEISSSSSSKLQSRSDEAYDLSGRRLDKTQLKRGIYVIGGRKTVVR